MASPANSNKTTMETTNRMTTCPRWWVRFGFWLKGFIFAGSWSVVSNVVHLGRKYDIQKLTDGSDRRESVEDFCNKNRLVGLRNRSRRKGGLSPDRTDAAGRANGALRNLCEDLYSAG